MLAPTNTRGPANLNPPSPPGDDFLDTLGDALTPGEVARRFGKHPATIYRWMDRGVGGVTLRYLKLGGRDRRVTRADLAAFVEEVTRRSRNTPAPPPHVGESDGPAVGESDADRVLASNGW